MMSEKTDQLRSHSRNAKGIKFKNKFNDKRQVTGASKSPVKN